MKKFDRSYIRYLRYAVQWSIFLFLVYAGYKFYFFVGHFNSPELTTDTAGIMSVRYPSVEGFLPIGALMALTLWLSEGIFDAIHPAGLAIFIAAILSAALLKKSFCGWICPVGPVSEAAWKLGAKIFKKNLFMNKHIDYLLRSVKYLLLAFFIYVIVIQMSSGDILKFLEEDYYKVADVKMLFFFTKMTLATFLTLTALFAFSLIYKNFWCRYLCPYGALLGVISFFSPLKITRNTYACINCGICSKECPSYLPVDKKIKISSPECTGCLTCVSVCPAKGALDVALLKRKVLHPFLFSLLVLIVFFGITSAARIAGKWNTSVTPEEYQKLIPQASILKHP